MSLKVLYLGGVFDECNFDEVERDSKAFVEYSANNFQRKMISGLLACGADLTVISAPFIGSWPAYGRTFSFHGFENESPSYTYVSFLNAWGFRNISRERSLKRAVTRYVAGLEPGDQLVVFAYSVHTPIVAAAVHAKNLWHASAVNLTVLDLPQYMNLEEKVGSAYKAAKALDARKFGSLVNEIDTFTLLTKHMAPALGVSLDKCRILEGLVDSDFDFGEEFRAKCRVHRADGIKTIAYTGKVFERFGVKNLIEAMKWIERDDVRLVLCGEGDCADYTRMAASQDPRIAFLGQVSPNKAREIQASADVLVNPRTNDDEFTRYSFPSKNIEYLMTGHPVVTHMLEGMPEVYASFCVPVADCEENSMALADAINRALELSPREAGERFDQFCAYARANLAPGSAMGSVLSMTRKEVPNG